MVTYRDAERAWKTQGIQPRGVPSSRWLAATKSPNSWRGDSETCHGNDSAK